MRSKVSSSSATVITGSAKTNSTWVMKAIQVKTGIFMSVMPGARMFSTVTVRFTAETVEPMPMMIRPTA